MDRRHFLAAGAALTTAVAAKPALSQSIDTSESSSGVAREFRAILGAASELKLLGPEVAGAGARSHAESPLDLAQLIIDALAKGPDNEDAAVVAQRAGLLLSELNRDRRDAADFASSGATPASTKYVYSDLKAEYANLYSHAVIKTSAVGELARAARIIASASAKSRYQEVERDTGVPWYVVGALHYREASLNFLGHLHNGDPLRLRTVHVPANRPPAPWPPDGVTDPGQLWRISAKDALHGLAVMTSKWTLQRTCYAFEAYNGFGCRDHGIKSPYLWNYTNWYSGGGFPRDHFFDPKYQSKQAGLVAILVELTSIEGTDVRLEMEA
jgi:lysozyme family protein